MHKFQPKNKSKLDNEWRRENLPPQGTLEKLGLVADDTVADVGCGIGYFTVPAAQIVNEENSVYALDISEEMLAEVIKRGEDAKITNIHTIQTSEYDLKIPDESVSFALLANIVHEVEDKEKFLREVSRILKPKGKVAVIEWEKKETKIGPPIDHRISKEEVGQLCNDLGLHMKEELEFAQCFYGLVVVKK
ncbi:class I SAM-dependent methyltransferase [Anaeromicrobium sediminis]|uniref:Methyltransferase n=1 Tax=Anaeromicrobium sediminis TaxID=1478221 RepID=A0A267MPN9_9FIRM|nr:methyltransferase domain-containing protein [Anaeromicrobium sediminis]PAB60690.1 methyltransferase [Anaeromicrobium sediminis]